MGSFRILTISTYLLYLTSITPLRAGETLLSSLLSATEKSKTEKTLQRQGRSYYDPRYGAPRPLYERLEYERPSRCGRCDEDYDRVPSRDRYDDDRRMSHRPTYGNRYDRNKNDRDEDQDRRYDSERRNGERKNGTASEENGDNKQFADGKQQYDDKDEDRRPSASGGSRRGEDRDRDRDRDYRNRYDDRDRYRPDYYDRFRDPQRERERVPYEDPYRERRPLYERNPYDRYDEGYGGVSAGVAMGGGRYDGYGYTAQRRPVYDDRFDRGNGYDDTGYGGYAPGVGRGPHDSFRPWDETYRGQAGWDAGGRGYYFASGRPEYSRPEPAAAGGWQDAAGYGGGYRDPLEYRGSLGYPQGSGYRQDVSTGYRPSGWHSVNERRPYRDQSGVNQLDSRATYGQPSRNVQPGSYGQQQPSYGQQPASYGQQPASYGQSRPQPASYGQSGNRGGIQASYGQPANDGTSTYGSTSTTPGTSYLYQREDQIVTTKGSDGSTKAPSTN